MEQVCIKNFSTIIEAEMAKGFLEANEIKSVIQKDASISGGGVAAGSGVGVNLFVLEKDVEKAKELLEIK